MAKIRCCGCGRRATRTVPDPHLLATLPLCDVCPSPLELLGRARALRATWPKWRRRQAAQERGQTRVFLGKVVTLGRLD